VTAPVRSRGDSRPPPRTAPPASRPRAAPAPGRAALRVVAGGHAASRRHRYRARRIAVGAAGLLAMGLLSALASHVALAQGQFRLEQLRARVAEEQSTYDRLRLEVAELESPHRIVAVARERLGMTAPPSVTYLAPSHALRQGGPPGGAHPPRVAPAPARWSTVKPHLWAAVPGSE
jgi:cell division protein FtsL